MREADKKKDKGKVEDRHQLLGLLRSMGVHLPRSTRLPEEMLEKKLTSAINFAQDLAAFSDRTPFNPSKLAEWKVRSHDAIALACDLIAKNVCRRSSRSLCTKPFDVAASPRRCKTSKLRPSDYLMHSHSIRTHSLISARQ